MKTTIIGDEYKELFEKAVTYLKDYYDEPDPQITNLSQYFNYLDKLTAHGEYEFLRVPVNEEEFVIDTTSRMIRLPSNINPSNKEITPWTVGVVGDHKAETLWFKVDRYFDGQDLSICFPIEGEPEKDLGRTYIIWQNGSVYEFDEVKYVHIDEEVIRFGWVLRDASLYKDGNLTFAVSFNYHERRDPSGEKPDTSIPPKYSFNTQYVTIPVQKSMTSLIGGSEALKWNSNISIEENISDQENFPRFSGVYNSSRGARPEIITDLPDIIDLDSATQTAELTIEARAVGEDAKLKYRWMQNGKIEEYEDDEKSDHKYEVSEVGSYQVQIGNQKGDITRWIYSSECIVPAAAQPVIKTQIYDKGYVTGEPKYAYPLTLVVEHGEDEGGRKIGEIHYQWYYTDLNGNNRQKVTDGAGIARADENGQFTITLNPLNIGIYSVEVYNTHNKTDSEKIVSDSCVVKKNAVSPKAVVVEYDDINNILKVTSVDIDNKYDLQYQWSYVENIDAGGVSTDWSSNDTYHPTRNGIYHCKVRQNVFADDGGYHTYTAGTASADVIIENL